MRIVFLGSGAFAVPSLLALVDAGHEVAAVITQPDREKGRGRKPAPPPVKPAAEERGITVLQPGRIRQPQAVAALRELSPELLVVVAYGQILPRTVLDIPPRGTVNVHSSLLPKYRGAAPIHWAIAGGEKETGVTTMLLDEGLDTGAILLARATPIGAEETTPELEPRLAALGARLLVETIEGLARGTVQPRPQRHEDASHAPLLRKEDGRLDWSLSAEALARRIRAFQPWPGAFTRAAGRELKVLRAAATMPGAGEPGSVVETGPDGLVVACGEGTRLRLEVVQPESRRPMPAAAFVAGAR